MARYIDADALINFLDVGHLRHPSELCFREVDVANLLLHAPTISPDEVRGVGKWKMWEDYYGSNVYQCSVCGADWDMIDGTPEDNDMNYCPHCGAKMKGAEENHTMDEFMYGQEMGSHSDGSL